MINKDRVYFYREAARVGSKPVLEALLAKSTKTLNHTFYNDYLYTHPLCIFIYIFVFILFLFDVEDIALQNNPSAEFLETLMKAGARDEYAV